MADSLILMVMALVVVGPRKLPQIGRQIGKLMYEFRKASNDFKFQMEEEMRSAEDADRRKQEEERRMALELAAPPLAPAPEAQTVEAQAGIGAVENATASPYPGEGEYPTQYPPETQAEVQPEASVPQIMAPSTGEQVEATRPGSSVVQADTQEAGSLESGTESAVDETTTADAAHEKAEPGADEQAAHHG
jgi:sec-independent protein translocase protein TatB